VTIDENPAARASADGIESAYAWRRLWVAVALGTIGSIGMWSVPVALPAVQADFGIARADAALPYTLAMFGFAFGGIWWGRMTDRLGIVTPVMCGAGISSLSYIAAAFAPSLTVFALLYGLIGLGTAATFGPLMTDISQWFTRRRGIAVALASSGNYLAGTVWPPLLQYGIANYGWRWTHIAIGICAALTMFPLVLLMRRRAPAAQAAAAGASASAAQGSLGLSGNALTALLCIAGLACCVAMAMPQVHIVAYCGDLGYGVARGAEMLSLMLGFGIFSRIATGLIADRLGGVLTLLLGSILQGVALFLYLFFDGLASLYVISALFGLFQGGLVPSYAIIVREYFSPREAGTRLGVILMATLLGMALGGWISGVIFDLAGSYQAAFLHGLGWNLLTVSIAGWLLLRRRQRFAMA
jgi:MFS family permease